MLEERTASSDCHLVLMSGVITLRYTQLLDKCSRQRSHLFSYPYQITFSDSYSLDRVRNFEDVCFAFVEPSNSKSLC